MKLILSKYIKTTLAFLLVILFSISCQSVKSDKEIDETDAIGSAIYEVIDALNSQNKKAMLSNYVAHENAMLVSPNFKHGVFKSREEYVDSLWTIFNHLESFKSTPNDDMQIKVYDGGVANVILTGRNDAVNLEGQSGSSDWLWTVQMEKVDSEWLIRNDNLKFFPTGDPQQITAFEERAKCCLASISPKIKIGSLALEMTTQFPVEWYSRVQTIPPVGYTASVSLTPTPLISDGREVGSLISGVVKFREVVEHMALEGTSQKKLVQ